MDKKTNKPNQKWIDAVARMLDITPNEVEYAYNHNLLEAKIDQQIIANDDIRDLIKTFSAPEDKKSNGKRAAELAEHNKQLEEYKRQLKTKQFLIDDITKDFNDNVRQTLLFEYGSANRDALEEELER